MPGAWSVCHLQTLLQATQLSVKLAYKLSATQLSLVQAQRSRLELVASLEGLDFKLLQASKIWTSSCRKLQRSGLSRTDDPRSTGEDVAQSTRCHCIGLTGRLAAARLGYSTPWQGMAWPRCPAEA
eukprot:358668-Chlamydomonas_euryale.AAC.4